MQWKETIKSIIRVFEASRAIAINILMSLIISNSLSVYRFNTIQSITGC